MKWKKEICLRTWCQVIFQWMLLVIVTRMYDFLFLYKPDWSFWAYWNFSELLKSFLNLQKTIPFFSTMDTQPSHSIHLSASIDASPSTLPPTSSSRRTTHYRDKGGMIYGLGVVWTHLRPFLPFFLISCLVVVLVYLLQAIVYGGPFTDPLFFSKFEQRWPPPSQKDPTVGPVLGQIEDDSQNMPHWSKV